MSNAGLQIFRDFLGGYDTINKSQIDMAKQLEVLAAKLESTYTAQTQQTGDVLAQLLVQSDSETITKLSTKMNSIDTFFRTLQSSYNASVQSGQSSLGELGTSASQFIQGTEAISNFLQAVCQALSTTL